MRSIFRFIFKTFKYHYKLISFILFIMLINIALSLLIPLYIGNAIDNIVGQGNIDYSELYHNLTIIASIAFVFAILSWIFSYLVNSLVQNYQEYLRNRLFRKIDNLPLSYIDSHAKGDIVSRFSIDIEQIGEGLNQFITLGLNGFFVIVTTIGFLYFTNWIVATIIVVFTPITFYGVNYIAKKNRHLLKKVAVLQGEMQGYASEIFKGNKALKSLNYQDKTFSDYESKNAELNKCGALSQFYLSLTGPVSRLLNYTIYVTVGVVSSLLYLSNPAGLSVGKITRLLAYCRRYSAPFNDISAVINVLYTTAVSLERVEVILHSEEESQENRQAKEVSFTSNFAFNNVSFSYNKKRKLIENLSFKIQKGQRIAIVGPTGAGKSTLINLIMQFYDIDDGDITIDDNSIYLTTREKYRHLFGLVLQDSWLFNGTIYENIAFSKKSATLEEVIEAAKYVHADHFINQLSKGYDTIINEDGGNLSEGQKQLICIARMVLVNSEILILDEATSNIDTRTEILVQEAFSKIMKGRTSFVVAHRLSTIKSADMILVVNRGAIVEQGNHHQLLENKGFYYELYNKQFD